MFIYGLIGVGLITLVAGAEFLVRGASRLASAAGISPLIIGLTVVAFGTRAPEMAVSVASSLSGRADIAVGNVVGSNIFNLLGVLGLAAVVAPNGIAVAGQAAQFDIPVMVAVAVACLPVFFTGHLIARWEGGLFLGYFFAYTATVVFMAANSAVLPTVRLLMFGFVIPLTVLTLIVTVARAGFRKQPA